MRSNRARAQKRRKEARSRYEKAFAIDPRAAVAANNLAWMNAEDGENLDVALQLAQTAKSRMPDRPEVNDTLGWIYVKKGLGSLAIPFLLAAATKDSANAEYHYHLGTAYSATGDQARAEASLQRALNINPRFEGADRARALLFLNSHTR